MNIPKARVFGSAPTANLAPLYPMRGSICIPFDHTPPGKPRRSVLFVDEIDVLAEADRGPALDAYRALGYTHAHVGPPVAGGYHHDYPDTDWRGRWDAYKAHLQLVRSKGQRIVFVPMPDVAPYFDGRGVNWDAVRRDLEPAYLDPEFQALVDVVQLCWEWNVSAAVWLELAQWAARVFPGKHRFPHMEPNHSAPCLSSELVEAGGTIENEGAAWRRIAPYVRGFFPQSGARYEPMPPPPGHRTQFDQFMYDTRDYVKRARTGYAGWPTVGQDGLPFLIVASEYNAFWRYQNAITEAEAVSWGDALVDIEGLAGYLDGGTKPLPFKE